MTPHTRSDFVVVANRLPVDRDPDTGGDEWRTAPGGLRSGWAMGGYLVGIAAMWATGLLAG